MNNQLKTVKHIIQEMLENRSFDQMLGFLHGGQRTTLDDQRCEGLTGTEFNPDDLAHPGTIRKITAATPHPYLLQDHGRLSNRQLAMKYRIGAITVALKRRERNISPATRWNTIHWTGAMLRALAPAPTRTSPRPTTCSHQRSRPSGKAMGILKFIRTKVNWQSATVIRQLGQDHDDVVAERWGWIRRSSVHDKLRSHRPYRTYSWTPDVVARLGTVPTASSPRSSARIQPPWPGRGSSGGSERGTRARRGYLAGNDVSQQTKASLLLLQGLAPLRRGPHAAGFGRISVLRFLPTETAIAGQYSGFR